MVYDASGMDPVGNFWGCHDRAMRVRWRKAPLIKVRQGPGGQPPALSRGSGPGAEPPDFFCKNRRPRTYLRASEIRKFIKNEYNNNKLCNFNSGT